MKKLTHVKFTQGMKLSYNPQELSQHLSKYNVSFVVALTTTESYVTHGLLIVHVRVALSLSMKARPGA